MRLLCGNVSRWLILLLLLLFFLGILYIYIFSFSFFWRYMLWFSPAVPPPHYTIIVVDCILHYTVHQRAAGVVWVDQECTHTPGAGSDYSRRVCLRVDVCVGGYAYPRQYTGEW